MELNKLPPKNKEALRSGLTIVLLAPVALVFGATALGILVFLALLIWQFLLDNVPWVANSYLRTSSIELEPGQLRLIYLQGPEASAAGPTGRAAIFQYSDGSEQRVNLSSDWGLGLAMSAYRVDDTNFLIVDSAGGFDPKSNTFIVSYCDPMIVSISRKSVGQYLPSIEILKAAKKVGTLAVHAPPAVQFSEVCGR